MEIKDLEIFKEVAIQQNISKTASKFNYVQSNITSRLTKLEVEVGCSLLIRNNKGVQLTQDGKTFLTYANKMLQLHREAMQELHSQSVYGQLQIGATDITTASRLPKLLTIFIEKYPTVEISLKNGSTEQLIEEVLAYNLDGAFITNPVNHPQLTYKPLITEEVVLVSNKEQRAIEKLSDIKNGTVLVFPSGCTYRQKMEQWISKEGMFLKKIEFGTIEGMIGCVKAGLGVALVSRHIAEQLNGDGCLQFYSVPEAYKSVETGFIYRSDAIITTALKGLVECAKKHIDFSPSYDLRVEHDIL